MLNRSIGLLGLALMVAACGNHRGEASDGGRDDAGVDSGSAGSSAGHSGSNGSAGRSGTSGGSAGKAGSSASAGRSGAAGKAGAGGKSANAGSGGKAQAGRGGMPAAGGGGASGSAGASGAGGEAAGEGGAAGDAAGTGGETAGESGAAGSAGTEAGSGEAGAAGESAGTSGSDAGAAGSSAGAGGSSGVPVAGSAELSDLNSADQATTVCGEIDANVSELDWHGAGVGYCSLLGLNMDPSTCTTSRDACVNANTDPTPPCSIDSIPKCTDVTVDEFVTCRSDYLMGFVSYYDGIDCTTDTTMLSPQPVPSSCTGPYTRCPQLMP